MARGLFVRQLLAGSIPVYRPACFCSSLGERHADIVKEVGSIPTRNTNNMR